MIVSTLAISTLFGQVKFKLEFSRFCLTALDKAGGERTLVCLVHNIKEIYTKITAKGHEEMEK